MDSLSIPFVRATLLSMKHPTDNKIINQITKYLRIAPHNTLLIHNSRPELQVDNHIKIVYIDVDSISWLELTNIVECCPTLNTLILKANNLIGGTSRLLSIIDNATLLKVFAVIVNGSHCNNIVNSSIFFRDWNSHVPTDGLHLYYQSEDYNSAVHVLNDGSEIDRLMVLNCKPEPKFEPIEALVNSITKS